MQLLFNVCKYHIFTETMQIPLERKKNSCINSKNLSRHVLKGVINFQNLTIGCAPKNTIAEIASKNLGKNLDALFLFLFPLNIQGFH